jgi:hypothetical protein
MRMIRDSTEMTMVIRLTTKMAPPRSVDVTSAGGRWYEAFPAFMAGGKSRSANEEQRCVAASSGCIEVTDIR